MPTLREIYLASRKPQSPAPPAAVTKSDLAETLVQLLRLQPPPAEQDVGALTAYRTSAFNFAKRLQAEDPAKHYVVLNLTGTHIWMVGGFSASELRQRLRGFKQSRPHSKQTPPLVKKKKEKA